MNQVITSAPGWSSALIPQSTEDAWRIAQALAKSGFVPKAFHNQPNEILIAAAMGARLGLDVFSALQSIAVVNGKPTLYGDALLAVCQSRSDWRGQAVKWDGEADSETVTVTIRRQMVGGEVDAYDGRFGVSDAKRAGLWGKQGPWTQFPRRMMEMRARAYALRGAFADALMGFYVREEMEDARPITRADSRFSDDEPAGGQQAPSADEKSEPKQALDGATMRAECLTIARELSDEDQARILDSFSAHSFAGVADTDLPALLEAIKRAKG